MLFNRKSELFIIYNKQSALKNSKIQYQVYLFINNIIV